MPANKFVLKGSGVEVIYTTGANPSLPALIYRAGSTAKQFKQAEIKTDNTGLGQTVSVALILTIDAGGERFGFFVPTVSVPHGQTVDFESIGVYETFGGPDSFPHQPASWRCIDMRGTAQTVIVPLAEPVRV